MRAGGRLPWSEVYKVLLAVIFSPQLSLVFSHSVTDPESELVAPAIVIAPKDTTVVAGKEAVLECIANAR